MGLPVLYSFRRCPYAIRARMALARAGMQWEHREVSLKNKPVHMLSLSQKGTVPVMQLESGEVIDESIDVMFWALESHDPDGWLETDLDAAMDLINENDFEFKVHLDHYKYHVRYPEYPRETYRDRAEVFLAGLDKLLENNRGKALLGSRASIADVAIFPFVRQFAGVDRAWFDGSSHVWLAGWLARWEQTGEFRNIMQKHEYWVPGIAPGIA